MGRKLFSLLFWLCCNLKQALTLPSQYYTVQSGIIHCFQRARVVQCWDHSLPTSVAWLQTLASMPLSGEVCHWFCPCFKKFFLQALWFSLLLKKLVFPNLYSTGMVDEEPLCGFSISKSLFISFNFFVYFPLPSIHFAWPHLPPSPPPGLKFCIYNRYFQFPLGIMVIPREIEVACAKFWGLMSYIVGNGKWWI